MSTSPDNGTKNVSAQVSNDFAEEFDRALKRAQVEGTVPLDLSRAEAIRRLMQLAIDDPSILAKVED
ncbi:MULTISPECIES: hypothetical protein [Haloferax]|uniref:hypothetical protein n=1 Tax=Haloferax TaxID=2251 RepID=UPI000AF77FA9|nr:MULTISPECIES: hypothetical protein [Haloferax]MDS0241885.1 hypothetical protein [Haloferax sp. S2CR25]MDS0445006.1 hypothetical protein [Haloferax sp. S2CR25-2]